MKRFRLRQQIFMALCCDLGLVGKKLIAPAANALTDLLHIPGGIGTSFSLMFLAIAAAVTDGFGCAALMGAVQGLIALGLGMVGSMGVLSPIGYVAPGLAIDVVLWLFRCGGSSATDGARGVIAASMAASVTACLTANLIVFHLSGLALALYACVACTSGAACGLLARAIAQRLRPVVVGHMSEWRRVPLKKRYIMLVAVMIACTATLAVHQLNTRAGAESGALLVQSGGAVVQIDPDALDMEIVEGTVVNGKGEERRIDAEGVMLGAVLEAVGVAAEERVRAVASDGYAAEVAAQELAGADGIWLIRSEDGWRLIVFGDDNARRDVKNVERIEVE